MDVSFPDLYNSAMRKAFKLSPTLSGVTLGPNASQSTTVIHELRASDAIQLVSNTVGRPLRLSSCVLRRPHRSTQVENRSVSHTIQKTLAAEIARRNQNELNKVHSAIEQAAKDKEEAILSRLTHANSTYRTQRNIEVWTLENKYLNSAPSIQGDVDQTKIEEDREAATRAQQRKDKLLQDVEESKKKRKILDALYECQKLYSMEYRKLLETIKQCSDKSALKGTLETLSLQQDTTILERIVQKPDQVTYDDLRTVDVILKNIRTVHGMVKREVDNINDAIAEKEKLLEKEKLKQEERLKPEVEERPAEIVQEKSSEPETFLDCFDSRSLATFSKYKEHLGEVNNTLEPLLKDDALKKFRFEVQKAVTTPVNSISPVSGEHMLDKYKKLHGLLSGQRIDANGVQPSQHPMGIILCKHILAKLMVRQGDMTVSSKPDAAFSIASILVNLWTEFPDFGDLVRAQFLTSCPYLAPVFLPQLEGQTNMDYYKSLGYQSYGGEIEKQDKFLKRMKGIMRLYAAVLITKPRNGKPNPLGIFEAWRWLAAILNLEPRPDICAVLILELLEVAGNELLMAYRGQFKKMLAYICQEYFPRLEKVSAAGGPLTRLEIFLTKVGKEGTIHPPNEILSPNFW